MGRIIRDSLAFAFLQGLVEHWNGCGGAPIPQAAIGMKPMTGG